MGKVIVIEGLDGTGKTTHFGLICADLMEKGEIDSSFEFPNYKADSSKKVRKYLEGGYGTDVPPKEVAEFFLEDQATTMQGVKDTENILCCRFHTSTSMYQGADHDTMEDSLKYLEWQDSRVKELGLSEPDLVILLDMPPEKSAELRELRGVHSSPGQTDILEDDLERLEKVYKMSKFLATHHQWKVISCVDTQGNIRTIADIQEEIKHEVLSELQS